MVQSYLENRTQQCSVSGSLSDSRVLTCSVPREKLPNVHVVHLLGMS